MSECGFIGLGRMGGAMARRLLDAGHRVTVYDPEPTAAAALAAHGAQVAASAKAVADAAPVVFLSLPTPQIVQDVVGRAAIRAEVPRAPVPRPAAPHRQRTWCRWWSTAPAAASTRPT